MSQFAEQDPSVSPSQPTPDSAPQAIPPPIPFLAPNVTYAIIGVTVFVYVLQMLSNGLGYSFNGIDLMELYGARINPYIRDGEIWRLITPVFLHASPLHIFFNMYALFSIGTLLEKYYGHIRFAFLYFLGAFSGNVFSFLLGSENGYSIGASTAIFGLFAAEAIFFYQNRALLGNYARQALTNMGTLIVVNILISLAPGIDGWGHLGGFLGGAIFAWFAGPVWKMAGTAPDLKLEDQRGLKDGILGTTVVLLIFISLTVLGFFKSS